MNNLLTPYSFRARIDLIVTNITSDNWLLHTMNNIRGYIYARYTKYNVDAVHFTSWNWIHYVARVSSSVEFFYFTQTGNLFLIINRTLLGCKLWCNNESIYYMNYKLFFSKYSEMIASSAFRYKSVDGNCSILRKYSATEVTILN